MSGDKRGDWWDKCALVCVCMCVYVLVYVHIGVCVCVCVVCAMKQCSITYGTLSSTDVTYGSTKRPDFHMLLLNVVYTMMTNAQSHIVHLMQ